MAVIKSQINTNSESFRTNAEAMQIIEQDLQDKVATIVQGGGVKSQERHLSRGKLLPRARIKLLLDEGSPFLEFSQFAAYKVYEDNLPASGIITGIGRIQGQECIVVANDATVKG
ncbi:MAG: methylcrotonoyl-CoA carboxylase, partial [Pseudomonadales bacterium]|nr:methylcrotonoyl-CoA carboxylase [Pseudomonadales bacterium]